MDSSAHQFLRRACGVIQNFDRDGRALVPLGAWPLILEDLQLETDGEQVDFLKSHLEVADGGLFSYMPLLEALGAVPARGPDESSAISAAMPPPDEQPPVAASPPASPPRQNSGPSMAEALRIDEAKAAMPSPPPEQKRPEGGAGPSIGVSAVLGSKRPSALEEPRAGANDFEENMLEDEETFWARRASTIRHFYNQWDCNQLTNETFTGQLQQILGTRVNLSNPDSEVMRLTNQNRYARNLKFAQLMSALRIDARNTGSTKDPGNSSPLNAYAPSESPSETPSYAAGRPSQSWHTGQLGGNFGRKHYTPSESCCDDDLSTTGSLRREPKPRTPAPFADMSELPSKPIFDRSRIAALIETGDDSSDIPVSNSGYSKSQAPVPRSSPPFAFGGNYDMAPSHAGSRRAGPPQSQQVTPQDPDFWSRRDPAKTMSQTNMSNTVQSDVMSQCGQSDVCSVAESNLEMFTARDRSGHGNILTWGTDSRQITPARKRQGRQVAMESEGLPRSQITSGVFPHLSPSKKGNEIGDRARNQNVPPYQSVLSP